MQLIFARRQLLNYRDVMNAENAKAFFCHASSTVSALIRHPCRSQRLYQHGDFMNVFTQHLNSKVHWLWLSSNSQFEQFRRF